MTEAEIAHLHPEVKAEIVPSNGSGVTVSATHQGAIELAIRQGTPVETLVKLFELKERAEASEARKAFDAAFAAFKAETPKLEKTKPVSFDNGKTSQYKYTPLDEIAQAVGPILARHGLSYNWEQAQLNEGVIAVCCILRHVQGHSIQNTLSAKADPSGSKNAIQAIGSAVSYLRRYTLLGVLGMATGDEDDDAVTMNEAADFLALISESRTLDELKKNYQDAVKDALAKQSPKAVEYYMKARQKRESELRKP